MVGTGDVVRRAAGETGPPNAGDRPRITAGDVSRTGDAVWEKTGEMPCVEDTRAGDLIGETGACGENARVGDMTESVGVATGRGRRPRGFVVP